MCVCVCVNVCTRVSACVFDYHVLHASIPLWTAADHVLERDQLYAFYQYLTTSYRHDFITFLHSYGPDLLFSSFMDHNIDDISLIGHVFIKILDF